MNYSPILGPFRDLNAAEQAYLEGMLQVSLPEVFSALNRRLNELGLCLTIGKLDVPEVDKDPNDKSYMHRQGDPHPRLGGDDA